MAAKFFVIFCILLVSPGCTPSKKCFEDTCFCTKIPRAYLTHLSQEVENNCGCPPSEQWWKTWNDEQLNAFIEIAIKCNPLVRITSAQTTQANLAAQIAYSQLFPQVGIEAKTSYTTFHLVSDFFKQNAPSLKDLPTKYQNLLQKVADSIQSHLEKQKSVGIGFRFPLDLFGKTQSLHKAAQEKTLIAHAMHQQALLHLVGSVCKAYFLIQTLEKQKHLLQTQLIHMDTLENLSLKSIQSGLLPSAANNSILVQKLSLQQKMLYLEEVTLTQKHLLSVLLGIPLSSLKIETKDSTMLPLPIPAIIDLSWLHQRPDIAASLHTIKSAQHNVSSAKAQHFPEILLSGSLGWEALSFSELFSPGTLIKKLLSMVSLPLFTGGAIKHGIALSEMDLCITEIMHEQNILQAIVELANALTQYIYQKKNWCIQKEITLIAKNSLASVEQKYAQQISRLSEKIEKEMDLLNKRAQELTLQNAFLQSSIDVIISLGGGNIHTCEVLDACGF